MKILTLGSTGMLGHTIIRKLSSDFEVIGTVRQKKLSDKFLANFSNIDFIASTSVEDFSDLKEKIKKTKPDVIINCIGIIKQLEAAKNPIMSIEVNSLFPHKLAEFTNKEDIKLIHFSTDCVFSGKKGGYTMQDIPDPVDLYGKTKLLGELSGKGCLTIRSSIIGRELYSRNGFVEWFLSNKGKKVRGYSKAIYSGFTTIEMCNIIKNIIKNNLNLEGVYQIASQPISKYQLLIIIKKALGLDIDVESYDGVVCDRSLDGKEFEQTTNYKSPSWDEMIKEFAKDNKFYDKWFSEEDKIDS